MLIVADENIPLVDAFFSEFAQIRRYPGRSITSELVAEADCLLVRSVTPVNRRLLQGSKVRFVGTCTIGTDHLDLDYFAEAGIAWANAPGCNARGVVDYVLGALLSLSEVTGKSLAQRCFGVVGVGQVGGRLVKVLKGLGWQVLLCDPPRAQVEGDGFVSLADILKRCDVISLHTPLDQATRHLLGRAELEQLAPGSWLINASRGPVVSNGDLKEHLKSGADLHVVLDVWEKEPVADPELARLCHIATPHIAGYSLEGKLRGTAQIYQAFCAAEGVVPQVQLSDLLSSNWLRSIELDASCDPAWALATVCRAVYDPRMDDADFRRTLVGNEAQRQAAFDALRKNYKPRREIDGLKVSIAGRSEELEQMLNALGCL